MSVVKLKFKRKNRHYYPTPDYAYARGILVKFWINLDVYIRGIATCYIYVSTGSRFEHRLNSLYLCSIFIIHGIGMYYVYIGRGHLRDV